MTYRKRKKRWGGAEEPLESSTSWKPVLCNDVLGGEREKHVRRGKSEQRHQRAAALSGFYKSERHYPHI